MCRLCGRMVKCIFDSMPSRVPSSRRTLTTSTRQCQRQPSQRPTASRPLRSASSLDSKSAGIPPTFLLPVRARLHQAAATHTEASPSSQFQPTEPYIPPRGLVYPSNSSTTSSSELADASPDLTPNAIQSIAASAKPLVLSKSLQQLLPALTSQPPFYIRTHIHRFPYLVTAGDTLRLPFHMHSVSPGDVLRFNRASLIGSRDYTLKAGTHTQEQYDGNAVEGTGYLDERLFECRCRVLGVDSEPMTFKEKTKRRQRKTKTVKSKHKYTTLRVMEVKVRGLEELKALEGVQLVME